jgi:hypothetical protein
MDDVVERKVETDVPAPAQEPERRAFFKKAFLTAAGMAFCASVVESADAQVAAGGVVHAGDINVIVTAGKVTLNDLGLALRQIVGMTGCTGCGMVGIDINFLRGEVVNPGTVLLPAVQSILVTAE